ncbi:ABC transporter substrate-binding protein [Allisonella histaminiformans]|uniref:ABC transporter substrate-binding protein n=1 Tax=Allisonella histaminiformans TaxID=209880 RepID=UPI00240A7A4B|nr:ABC transporter substrate-binding protein [Allisonella histaminiformans]MDD6870763.1 ABC transporter substrate-binding protein [Allisonella histaminiformans]MDY3957488.1 ABC transporter substrate-binding protein [Allisonella histaminiformans]
MKFSKTVKTIGAAMIIAAVAAGMTGCGNKEGAASGSNDTAQIGFIAALSGSASAYGISQQEGINMAAEEINKSGFKVNIQTEDSKGAPQDAINAAQKMMGNHVSVIIGPMTSNEAKAVWPMTQQAGIPTLGISITAEGMTDGGNYLFRNSVPESMNIPQTVKKTHAMLGYKNVAILYANDNEQHVTAEKYFEQALKAEGVNIVAKETFASKDSDFSAQLTNIQGKNPDAVVICSLYQEGALILKKMREMGMNQPVLGDNGFVSPELGKLAGKAADNVYVSSMWSPNRNDEKTKAFVANYTKKYGHAPDQFAAGAYDGVYMVVDAMKRAGTTTDKAKIRNAMAQMKNFSGVCGTFSFNEKRDPVVDLVLLKMKDGVFQAAN